MDPLPPPWVLRTSTTFPGRIYFFNPQTKKSSWVHPPAQPKKRSAAAAFAPEVQYVYSLDYSQSEQVCEGAGV